MSGLFGGDDPPAPPPPPPPPADTAGAQERMEARAREERLRKQNAGRASTILSGSMGDTSQASVTGAALLGG